MTKKREKSGNKLPGFLLAAVSQAELSIHDNRMCLLYVRGVEMSLFEGITGKSYEIRGLYVEEGITRRLQALGLNDGTIITVLNRKKDGALIIRVRGTRLAIGRHISQGIDVEERAL